MGKIAVMAQTQFIPLPVTLFDSERRQLWFLAKWKEFYYLETRRISVTNERFIVIC